MIFSSAKSRPRCLGLREQIVAAAKLEELAIDRALHLLHSDDLSFAAVAADPSIQCYPDR